ncbi:hypothetical protein [Scandinavium goeteborgense]|uniref:hypothetical protein n=1 Tax=Scandinavium goeteborgense TaxID=1851514 RepID=UPI000F6781A8|nr:hypothetical protein [Scandinavium goeteborgense]QKN82052.1 hypothetical protein A8O29_012435 [Scandinavium goeteborgense]
MSDTYALINIDNIVTNIVVWDGEGEMFDGFQIYKIEVGDFVGPGYIATRIENKWFFTAPEEITNE